MNKMPLIWIEFKPNLFHGWFFFRAQRIAQAKTNLVTLSTPKLNSSDSPSNDFISFYSLPLWCAVRLSANKEKVRTICLFHEPMWLNIFLHFFVFVYFEFWTTGEEKKGAHEIRMKRNESSKIRFLPKKKK